MARSENKIFPKDGYTQLALAGNLRQPQVISPRSKLSVDKTNRILDNDRKRRRISSRASKYLVPKGSGR